MGKRAWLISPCAKRHKRCNCLEDRISQMPNEILVSILSQLTMKEAARTSVLSRRWRYLWTSIPCLNFDATETLSGLLARSKILGIERTRYISWVNQVIKSYQGPTIEVCRVRFDLNSSFSHDIDRLVHFAIEKGVKRLELDLSCYFGFAQNEPYPFLPLLCSTKLLRSRPLGFSSCCSLTSLRLKFVNISGEVLEYFLSSCKFLEELCVDGSSYLVDLKVAGPSLKLKYLHISYCFNVRNIEISAANLVSINYFGPKISMSLKNVPNLIDLSIGGDYCEYFIYNPIQFSSYLLHLKTLTLDINIEEGVNIEFLEFPLLNNLKELKLIVDARDDESLLGFTSMIKASPFLYRFTLQLSWIKPYMQRRVQRAAKCSHQNLKVVELVGFVGRTIDVELAMFFIESAVALERIIFDPRHPWDVGRPWEFEETKEKRAARKRAEQLCRKLPPGTSIVL